MNKKEVKKAPALRFKGFTNDWEQRKLEKLSDVRDGTHTSPHFYTRGYPLITSKNLKNGSIIFNNINYISQKDFNKINKRSKVNKNDILMGMIGTVGNIAFITEEPNFAIKNVALIKDIGHIVPFYTYKYLQSLTINKQIKQSMDGGTQKFLALNKIRNLVISFPTIQEQEKISNLFSKVDSLISLQQRKLKLLKVMKKALSQYMFCQEIEFVPILRFNSFSDKWKYERLKNLIVKEIKGKAKADMKGTKSTYIDTALLNGGSITKVDSSTDTFHNDIIILWDGSQAGKIYHGFTGALGSTLKSYKPKYSGGFLYQYLKSKEPIIFLRYRTPNIPHVVKDFTEIFKINVPSVKEQEKISKTLNYLDQSILVETKKIGSIKKIKKFLLQNMFI